MAQESAHDRADGRHMDALRHHAYTSHTVRRMEQPLLERGMPLMRMAASTVAHVAAQMLAERDVVPERANIVVLAGAGDNGGDGLFAGAQLARHGASVTTIATGRSLHMAGLLAFTHAGGQLLVLDAQSTIPGAASGFSAGEAGERLEMALDMMTHADMVIDAMTGIGARGALRGVAATLCRTMVQHHSGAPQGSTNQRHSPSVCSGRRPLSALDASSPLILAVDVPSGVSVDDGALPGDYMPADVTVMCGAMKPCAVLPPASEACGTLVLADFGFDLDAMPCAVTVMNDDLLSQVLRRPFASDSKYSRGAAGMMTGSQRYPGAAVLGCRAAAASNIGMVRYVGPSSVAERVLDALPEAVVGKGHVQAWVAGSGVPDAEHAQGMEPERVTLAALLKHYDASAGSPHVQEAYAMPALVVDAGALDLLPDRVPPQVVLTPHTGELARLLSLRGESAGVDDIIARPWYWARKAQVLTGATVLLKGAITVVVGPTTERNVPSDLNVQSDAAGENTTDDAGTVTLTAGNGPAWLATAGSGDVLAGILGALLAQQDEAAWRDHPEHIALVAAAASRLHGLAAGQASGGNQCGWRPPLVVSAQSPEPQDLHHSGPLGHPITASDLIAPIPHIIGSLLH